MFLLHTMGYKFADCIGDLTPAQTHFLISAAEYRQDMMEEEARKRRANG